MPHAATLRSASAAMPGVQLPLQLLFALVAVSALAGALAIVLFEHVEAVEVIPSFPPSFARLAEPPQTDTSVPDASSVFAGREPAIEEPVPTF